MADKHLKEQAAFYNLHKGTIWTFREYGHETGHFSKILSTSVTVSILRKVKGPSHHKLLYCLRGRVSELTFWNKRKTFERVGKISTGRDAWEWGRVRSKQTLQRNRQSHADRNHIRGTV